MIVLAWGSARAFGQGLDTGFISRSAPSPAFLTPEPARYNLKFGKLEARIRASLQLEANDNINLSAHGRAADISINPHGAVGFVYPITEIQLLELNLDMGYQWYLFHTSVSQFSIDPKTRIDYRLRLVHPIEARVYDSFSIVTDPTSRPDISGPEGELINFDLLNETIGILFNWEPNTTWRFSAGYSYGISRSLTSDFDELDVNTHTFSVGAYYRVSPRLTVGVAASYGLNYYSTNYSATAQSYTIGPNFIFRPSQFISVNGAVGYTTMTFGQSGFYGDTSQPGANVSAQLNITHKINRLMSEDFNLSNGLLLGLENNYNQILSMQYGLSARFSAGLTLRTSITYNALQSSGPQGENAGQYLFYIGTGRQITRLWSTSIGYSFALKDSSLPDNNYVQNRLTLDITREF